MFGAALAALCCVGLLTAGDGDSAHAEPLPQAMRGASAAAGALTPAPAAGLAVAAEVPPDTTQPPPTTTTTVPTTVRAPAPVTTPQPTHVTITKGKPTVPLTTVPIPSITTPPTRPSYPWHHHCYWGC